MNDINKKLNILTEDKIIEILTNLNIVNGRNDVIYDFVKNNSLAIHQIIVQQKIPYNQCSIFNSFNPLMFLLNYSETLNFNENQIDFLLKNTDLNQKNSNGLTPLSMLLSIPKEKDNWSNIKSVDLLHLTKKQIQYIIENTNLNDNSNDYLTKGLEYNNPLWIMNEMIKNGANLYKNDYFIKIALEKKREDFFILLFEKYLYQLSTNAKNWLAQNDMGDILLLEKKIIAKEKLENNLLKKERIFPILKI